jgi:hypothetical protein
MEKQALPAIVLSLLTLVAFRYFQAYRTTRAPKMQRAIPTAVAPNLAPASPALCAFSQTKAGV